MLLWGVVQKSSSVGKDAEVPYSDLLDKIESGQVLDVAIQGTELHGHLKSSPKDQFHTTIPANTDSLTKDLHAAKVNFQIKDPRTTCFCLFCSTWARLCCWG